MFVIFEIIIFIINIKINIILKNAKNKLIIIIILILKNDKNRYLIIITKININAERIKIMKKEVRINVSVPEEIHYQLKLEALTERKNLKDKIVEILKGHCSTKKKSEK